jgi:hypothetical protein
MASPVSARCAPRALSEVAAIGVLVSYAGNTLVRPAEQAESAARDAAFEAATRWIETDRIEDMERMNDADTVVDRAEESRSSVEDALSAAE